MILAIGRAGAMRAARGALAGALIAVGLSATARAASDLADLIPRIKQSVVGVGTLQELRRPPAKLHGTGFVVGDGTQVITNHHVVAVRLDDRRSERLVIFQGSGENVRLLDVEVVASDVARDVAVLRIKDARLPPLVLAAEEKAREGTAIAFTGYPIGQVLGVYPVTHRGMISALTPVAIPQVSPQRLDPKMIKRLRERIEVYQLDATAYPGNSGSPLYDARTGEVYGIVSSVFVKETKEKVLSDPSGITYAVPIRFARDLLDRLAPAGGR